ELLGLDQAVGEPACCRLHAAVEPPRKAHLARLAEAHALDEEVRARQLRDEADLDEEHPEARLLRGDDHVEGQDHGHADADGGAPAFSFSGRLRVICAMPSRASYWMSW